MKTTLFSFVALSMLSIVNAQTFGTVNSSNVGGASGTSNAAVSYLMGDIKNADKKRKEQQLDIQGSAYTTESFLPGKLLYKDKIESTVFYRYNAYMEEIEIRKVNTPESSVQALHRDKDIYLKQSDGKVISFKTFIDKKNLTQNGYLTLLANGKYKFYKRVDVKFTEGQKAQNSFVKATPARFSKFTEYYLQVPGKNRIDELKISNRHLMKQMPEDKKVALKNYLKENKIKVTSEADIISVLDWLDQQ